MTKMSAFSTTDVQTVLKALQNYVLMRNYNQSTRNAVFLLFSTILGHFKSFILESISKTFIKTFIHITSGEKDPRNLMVSFQISKEILSLANDLNSSSLQGPVDPKNIKIASDYQSILSSHTTDLFDVVFCYFPITFEPPKNDPYGITSLDLKLALRNSLAANGVFASEAFPSLMDKMAASALKVKNEALATIVACIENYDPKYTAPLWKDIWDGLKYEVLHGSDETVGGVISSQDLTLDALRALAVALLRLQKEVAASPVQIEDNFQGENKPDPFDSYLDTIVKETVEQICDTTNKKSIPSAFLVSGIANASPFIFEKLSTATLGKVLQKTAESSGGMTITAQKNLLKITKTFIEAAKNIGQEVEIEGTGERFAKRIQETKESLAINALLTFKDQMLDLFTKSLMGVSRTEHELRNLAVENISSLICIQETGSSNSSQSLLTSEELSLILQYLDDVFLLESTDESGAGGDKKGRIELANTVLQTLVDITKRNEQVILNVVYPFFLSKLPDSDTSTEEGPVLIGIVLRALSRMASVSRTVFEVFYVRIFNKLDIVLRQGSDRYTLAIFSTLATVLCQLLYLSEDKSEDDINIVQQNAVIFSRKLVPLIFTRFITGNDSKPLSNIHVVVSAAMCIMYIVQALPLESQKEFLCDLFALFWTLDTTNNSKLITKGVKLPTFRLPFDDTTSNGDFSVLAVFFCYSISSVSTSVVSAPEFATKYNLTGLVINIFHILEQNTINGDIKPEDHERNKALRLIYLRTMSILLNKWVKSSEIKPFVEDLKITIYPNSAATGPNDEKKKLNALETLTWAVKAYLIRNDNLAFTVLPFFLSLLGQTQDAFVGVSAAKLMELLVVDGGLNPGPLKSGCVVRKIYKHRFFVAVLEPLIGGFEGSTSDNSRKDLSEGMSSAKVNHLVALSGILRWMPSSIITPYISKFFGLLLQSLTVNDGRVREASINTITAVVLNSESTGGNATPSKSAQKEPQEFGVSVNSAGIADTKLTPESSILNKTSKFTQESSVSPAEFISQHLSTLIPALVSTCLQDSENSYSVAMPPSVRVAALKCLDSFVEHVPNNRLLPHTKTVIRELGKVVDDKRRIVRKEAVWTRQKYYEMGIQELDD